MNVEPHACSSVARAEARARWDGVAKPLRSLGRFEYMIARVAGIQSSSYVTLSPRCALLFCGDHGMVAEGVTQSGSEVTAMLGGRAVFPLLAAALCALGYRRMANRLFGGVTGDLAGWLTQVAELSMLAATILGGK